jgi:ferritin-like metal-binding protein YciE
MTTTTPTETFERELQKLYHAELEILDMHADLAAAAASEEVEALFAVTRRIRSSRSVGSNGYSTR